MEEGRVRSVEDTNATLIQNETCRMIYVGAQGRTPCHNPNTGYCILSMVVMIMIHDDPGGRIIMCFEHDYRVFGRTVKIMLCIMTIL